MTFTTTDTRIGLTVPAQTLHYTPGADPTQFVVEVVNQSDRFATMQLDLFAPGNEDNSTVWYDLTPEISTRKPPGDRTNFHITILGSPIPGFAGLTNLTIRVTSLELGEERRIIRLYIDPGGELPIEIKMPVRQFQSSPLEQVHIPIYLKECHPMKKAPRVYGLMAFLQIGLLAALNIPSISQQIAPLKRRLC
ncbi:MAG: hypothetical protein AAFU78_03915 [Cyanobacteria bacterium J06633_2]